MFLRVIWCGGFKNRNPSKAIRGAPKPPTLLYITLLFSHKHYYLLLFIIIYYYSMCLFVIVYLSVLYQACFSVHAFQRCGSKRWEIWGLCRYTAYSVCLCMYVYLSVCLFFSAHTFQRCRSKKWEILGMCRCMNVHCIMFLYICMYVYLFGCLFFLHTHFRDVDPRSERSWVCVDMYVCMFVCIYVSEW